MMELLYYHKNFQENISYLESNNQNLKVYLGILLWVIERKLHFQIIIAPNMMIVLYQLRVHSFSYSQHSMP
ncbi:hypothetical protein CJ307_20735 [Klebsiella quasipneumoniae]|nr:hypothetical protein CJ307_20735 [Klebsiella quasipneumoniae]